MQQKFSPYNGSNLIGIGEQNSNPYDIIQQGGKRRKTRRVRKKVTIGKKKDRKKKLSRTCVKPQSFINMAARYFNIY
jgi:hypothetical protein